MESLVWILGPVVVAFFGFLFWLVIGKLGSENSNDEKADDSARNPAEHSDE